MPAATRSEIHDLLESVRNTLLERLAPRQYIQALVESLRVNILQNLLALHTENQQLIRNEQVQRAQVLKRLYAIEKEMKSTHQLLYRVIDKQEQTNEDVLRTRH